MEALSLLMQQVANGRGCWIGLFSSTASRDHGFKPLAIGGYSTSDPHVTLAHLGRASNRSESWMRGVLQATGEVAANAFIVEAYTHGIARFRGGKDGDPVVYLLRGVNLLHIYDLTLRQLRLFNVGFDDRYHFLPHVTVGRVQLATHLMVDHPSDVAIAFDRVTLVCGDVRVPFELKPSPF